MYVESFWDWALCFGGPLVLFGVVVVATLSYLLEQLEASGFTAGAWGHIDTPQLVDDAAYRSAPVVDRKPAPAPTSVVRIAAAGFSIALFHLGHGTIGVITTLGYGLEDPVSLLRYLFATAAGAGLFWTSSRFLLHRPMPGQTAAAVQVFHTVACALTLLSACSHGGGRELLFPLFYGVAWLLVVAMWLSPFRAADEPSSS